jgi:D-ribose pyranase
MKRTTLLHAELSRVIASLGHGDTLVIGDAGLPIPAGPQRIDLAVMRGVPGMANVLAAVLSEMQVEGVVLASEAVPNGASLPGWYPQTLAAQGIAPQTVSHEEFKLRCASARAVVRTGECTPYANILLVAGVAF